MNKNKVTIDGNEAAAYSAYNTNEVIAIYPITPSSTMGELADQWAAEGKRNIWDTVPQVTEMQSEGGASGAVHGALQVGALTTTFTASQGLLLMIPNMFKIAGELTSTVFHVSARTVATHALSIFGDHSDVMATRSTGWAMLASNSVQEAGDLALIAQAATLHTRVPFLHFFDGFRTSSEVAKSIQLTREDMKAMVSDEMVRSHRERALSPDRPFVRGTAQNPDVFFQSRERINPFYSACPDIVQKTMDQFASVTGRKYSLFDYMGAPNPEKLVILMGSGAEVAHEAVEYLNAKGEQVGLLKVRLYRPFSLKHFFSSIPKSVKHIAVLDRTKEPGASGEPLYVDVLSAISEAKTLGMFPADFQPRVLGGRYGLSSKEFTPAMVKAVFDEMQKKDAKIHFTVGIHDDVTHLSLDTDRNFSTEPADRTRAVFYGLGSDGTVSANKSSIKIIGGETDFNAQGYFVYDSKKAGAVTISHLRFGTDPIHSSYLINKANFVACHQFSFLERFDMTVVADTGAVFLLNSPFEAGAVWDHLPKQTQEGIIRKKLRFFIIDAYKIAKEVGLGVRINTIMQTCFFAISNVLPKDQAIGYIKDYTKKNYGKRGESILQMNYRAIDMTLANLHEVKVPDRVTSTTDLRAAVPANAPEFVRKVTARIIAGQGDELPVSAFPIDGTFPSGTTQWEKRNIALEIPVWDPETCIQCGKCTSVCPHAVIRAKVFDSGLAAKAPKTFKSAEAKWKEFAGMRYALQASPEDCTGCSLCVQVCPSKNKQDASRKAVNMAPQAPLRESENENWNFFQTIPNIDRNRLKVNMIKDIQLLEPLFEFSGACAGCGETPYVQLISQLFGDRMIIANATGCSSIYGGNLPTTPFSVNKDGRGPAWSNSLFEDNAEFGMGFRLAEDKKLEFAGELLKGLSADLGDKLVQELLNVDQSTETGINAQRGRIAELKKKLAAIKKPEAARLASVADSLIQRSIWIVGGDGWAYDIGYGGLDHVIASGRNVNILVLDTEVYSNTGGQMSKATPRGAVAKFAAAGKPSPKKDLAMMAMAYTNVYVARIALGANDAQAVKAILEAEAYEGPSIVVAYCHCIAHGYNLIHGLTQQKAAVQSGYWPLIRYNPNLPREGKNPLTLDSKAPSISLEEYIYKETRYSMLTKSKPDRAKLLLQQAQEEVLSRWKLYEHMANMQFEPKLQFEAKRE
jgi:pyruvate-ferredoxin/flavodoxin oxidoreductase